MTQTVEAKVLTRAVTIKELMEAYERLSEDEQEDFFDLLKKKRIEIGRSRITADIEESRRDYAAGRARVATPKEIIEEAYS